MKQFRLGTLMLVVALVALGIGLVVQHRRSEQREARLHARIALLRAEAQQMQLNALEAETVLALTLRLGPRQNTGGAAPESRQDAKAVAPRP